MSPTSYLFVAVRTNVPCILSPQRLVSLLDEPISTETGPSGKPIRFTARSGRYEVRRILGTWQAPGEARLFRLQVTAPHGLAVAEVVGPAAMGDARAWRLIRIWD